MLGRQRIEQQDSCCSSLCGLSFLPAATARPSLQGCDRFLCIWLVCEVTNTALHAPNTVDERSQTAEYLR